MATYSQRCSSVGGYSYANNFTLYVILNETNVNVGANTSQIQYNVYCQSNGSGSIGARHLKYFNLNGQDIINSTVDVSASSPNAYIGIANGTTGTIAHNSDGSKSVSFTARIQASSYGLSATVSGTFTLSTIPRASSITCTTANVEETAIININSASSGFRHNVRYGFGNLSGYILNNVAGGSHSWVIPSSFYAQFPNQKTTQGTLWCETYSGGSKIGESTYIFTVTTNESKCKPSISGTVVDTNATTKALTGDANKLIKYKSTAQATITATAKNSATISKKTINGTTVSGNTLTIANVSTNSFTFSTTDSRGYTNSTTKTPTMVNYVPLTISANFFRPQPTTGQISLSFSGNYFNGSFGATSNTLSIQWYWKESTASNWTSGGTITPVISNNTFRSNGNISLGTSYDYQKSYNFYLLVKDKLTTLQPNYTVSVGKPIVDWGKNFFNVNGQIKQNNNDIYNLFVSGGGLDNQNSFDGISSGQNLNHSWIGTIQVNNVWYNLINVRHRNGIGDGTSYGMQIRGKFSTNPTIQTRAQASGTWGDWRTILKLKGLYVNDSGTNGTITLNESIANFAYIEVFYGDGSNFMSQKIHNPNGKTLYLPFSSFTNNRVTFMYQPIKFSGTSVTRPQGYSFNYEGQSTLGPYLKIFRILGYN